MALIWPAIRIAKDGRLVHYCKEKMIISDGYKRNSFGFENVCEDEDNRTKPYVLHAEAKRHHQSGQVEQQQ